MTPSEHTEFWEHYLSAKANNRTIAFEIEDLVRTLIRTLSSQNPSRGITGLLDKIGHIQELVRRCPDFDPHRVVGEAMHEISDVEPNEGLDPALLDIATTGMKYFAEKSATDGPARARASKRCHELMRSIDDYNALRDSLLRQAR